MISTTRSYFSVHYLPSKVVLSLLLGLCVLGRVASFMRLTPTITSTVRSPIARLPCPLRAMSPRNPGSDYTGDEEFEDEDKFDGEKAVPTPGSPSFGDDVERDFLSESTGVGPVVYVQLAPLFESLVTKFVSGIKSVHCIVQVVNRHRLG